jgi:(5-formylfuran-3-yl)methyl phosphate synthase
MIRLLASVRDEAEALAAAHAGADVIDLKEPGEGALGAVPVATIARVVALLRDAAPGRRISACRSWRSA